MSNHKTNQTNKRPPIAINPFEQLSDFVSDTVKKVPQEIANTFIPGPELWGSPTPKPESMPGGPNFSPVDFNKLQNQYQQQDSPDIDQVRKQLQGLQGDHMQRHQQFKREEEEYYLRTKQEEAEEERQEELAKQQQEQDEADQAEAAQQQSTPHGKVRKNILGGGKKAANMELPPEVRSERKGGAGKH